LTKNIEGFSRFLRVAASSFAQAVDLTKVGSLSSVQRLSVARFYEILEDTMLVHRCDPFAKDGPKRLAQHPKFYFFDNGVLNGLLGSFAASGDRKGRLFENLLCAQILASAKAKDLTVRLSTYRTSNGAEVDFVLEIGEELVAIEAKVSGNLGPRDLGGFESFKEFVGKRKHRRFVLTLGGRDRTVDGIPVLDWQRGLVEIGL
jgi:predicted AAA+ superfamily ATPase